MTEADLLRDVERAMRAEDRYPVYHRPKKKPRLRDIWVQQTRKMAIPGMLAGSIVVCVPMIYDSYVGTPATNLMRDIIHKAGDDALLGKMKNNLAEAWLPWVKEQKAGTYVDMLYRDRPEIMVSYFNAMSTKVEASCKNERIDNCFDYMQKNILTAYTYYQPTDAFKKWDDVRRNLTLDKAETDINLMIARSMWDKGSDEDKLDLRTRAIETYIALRMNAYGDAALPMQMPTLVLENLSDDSALADFTYRDGKPIIRMRPANLLAWGMDDVMTYIAHEIDHAMSDVLINAQHTPDGKAYLKQHGLEHDARMLELAHTTLAVQYVVPDPKDNTKTKTGAGYRINPHEQIAFFGMSDGRYAGADAAAPGEFRAYDAYEATFTRVPAQAPAPTYVEVMLRPSHSATLPITPRLSAGGY